MKLLIQIFLLVFFYNMNVFSGESGDLPGQEIKPSEEVFDEKPKEKEGMDVSGINEILEPKDTQITLPKNRLEQIFDQYFLAEINKDKLTINEIEAVAIFVSTEGKNWKNKLSSFVQ